jgi:hypothetical protein
MIRSKWTSIVILSALCLSASAAYAAPPVFLEISRTLSGPVRDVNGVRPGPETDPATPLYTTALGTPLLAPDGHQLTWGEWDNIAATGASTASVKCVNKGTHIVLHFEGLIPNALYSMWLFVRLTATSPIDVGKLPSRTSDGHVFVSNAAGKGTISVIAPAGPLSISGEIPGCLFAFEDFSLNLAYHSDGHLYGNVPGPDGVTVQQFQFGY